MQAQAKSALPSRPGAASAQASRPHPQPLHHAKFLPQAPLSLREEAWWERRAAQGSDWMEEWIGKPGRR
ncbi:MAG: hypothetical protein ABW005_10170 [Burkholderiaceae bacterium]